MHWTGWIVIVLVGLNAGWMTFDGMRALTIGDYVTPSSGEHSGQLGLWSNLVERVGINPRSTLMKVIFVSYGVIALFMMVCFALNLSWAWWGMVILAVLGLWYLPIGTAINVIVLVLLLLPSLRLN